MLDSVALCHEESIGYWILDPKAMKNRALRRTLTPDCMAEIASIYCPYACSAHHPIFYSAGKFKEIYYRIKKESNYINNLL